MAPGKIQRRIVTLLNDPDHRGRWFETRHIADALFGERASQDRMAAVRQALRGLERVGEVERFGIGWLEWRSTRYPEVGKPQLLQAAMTAPELEGYRAAASRMLEVLGTARKATP